MRREREAANDARKRELADKYHSSEPSRGPECVVCGKATDEYSKGMMVDGKAYHVSCFTCGQCHKVIGAGRYYAHDGKSFCSVDCINAVREAKGEFQKCDRCHHAITTGGILKALNQTFHDTCFTCTNCNGPFEGGRFFQKDGKPYCEKCM
jgi:hypothetical protein